MCQSLTTFIARMTSHCRYVHKAFLVARWQRIHPSVLETRVLSLGWEDPLGKKMVTHSSVLAWEIPWTKEPGGLRSMGSQRVGHGLVTKQQIYHALLISSPVDGHLHCSFWLTLLWTWMHKYYFKTLLSILSDLYLEVKLLDHVNDSNSILIFKESPNCFPHWLQHFASLQRMYQGSSFFTSSKLFFFFLNQRHPS